MRTNGEPNPPMCDDRVSTAAQQLGNQWRSRKRKAQKNKSPKENFNSFGTCCICKFSRLADFHFWRILSGRDALRLLTTLAKPNAERCDFSLLARYLQQGHPPQKSADPINLIIISFAIL
ncbi:hypothetical protein [Bacteroides sp. UBA939]|uniref:hypothetical protein n=1 Tax=Bacteroides sp. UBA939 TaxID=1946092 RepID=UPI0025C5784A|nr:hypothetical protein [Bacteroides sp. UBA939]